MDANDLLNIANKLLLDSLSDKILDIDINLIKAETKCIFKDCSILYIRYNNFSEYSYNLIFSQEKFDRARFDNFDEKWDVNSKPHHFHPRFKNLTESSPMVGNPKKDIPLLVAMIKNGDLMIF